MLFIQATTKSGTFFRAGRMWTKDGTVIDPADFSDAQIAAIEVEPNLKVRKATDEEVAAAKVAAAVPTKPEVIDALLAAIPQMADADFTAKGLPDLTKLREAVTIDGKLVTSALRDAAMEKLIEVGFNPPSRGGA